MLSSGPYCTLIGGRRSLSSPDAPERVGTIGNARGCDLQADQPFFALDTDLDRLLRRGANNRAQLVSRCNRFAIDGYDAVTGPQARLRRGTSFRDLTNTRWALVQNETQPPDQIAIEIFGRKRRRL